MKDENKKKTVTDKLVDALFANTISDEKPGPGWFSIWDLAKKYNLSRSHTTKKVAAFMREGKMEMKKFRMILNNSPKVVPMYKVVCLPCRTVGKKTNRD
jgi:hypothetical protein